MKIHFLFHLCIWKKKPEPDVNICQRTSSVQIKSPGHDCNGVSAVVADVHPEQAVPRHSGLPATPGLGEDVSSAECS